MARSGARLPLQICNAIKAYLDDSELSTTTIATKTGVCKRTVERMRLSYEHFSTPYPDSVVRNVRPHALTKEQERVYSWFYIPNSLTN